MGDKQKEFVFNDKTYLIEKDVERSPQRHEISPWKKLYGLMEIGESVLLSKKESMNFLSLINAWRVDGVSGTRKVSVRKVDDEYSRVWKIK